MIVAKCDNISSLQGGRVGQEKCGRSLLPVGASKFRELELP